MAGLVLGSLTSFTGTLSVQAGSLATSAANQLTGNYAVSLAAGGTLQLGGNDTLPTAMNTGLGTIAILSSNTVSIANTSARRSSRPLFHVRFVLPKPPATEKPSMSTTPPAPPPPVTAS